MTYSWSLSWANVDKAFYVEQETKAGFWNQDIQVFLIQEYIQGLVFRWSTTASFRTIQEQYGVLTSRTGTLSAARGHKTGSWANFIHKDVFIVLRKDEEKFRYTLSQCGQLTGTTWFLLSVLQTEIPPRQGSFSFLTVWSADHPHPWIRGCNLAQGRGHPFPPQERGQETSVQVNDCSPFMKQRENAQVPSQCPGRGSGGSQHDGTTRSGANSSL